MKLKTEPADFVVEEIASREWKKEGRYHVYLASKTDMTTTEMIRRVCASNNLPQKDVRYAGLKDRRAVTSQYITTPKPLTEPEGVTLERIGHTDEHLHLGELKANRFTIIAQEVKSIHEVAIPNYYGDQRFSRNNVEIGLKLVKGDFKGAREALKHQYPQMASVQNPIDALRKVPQKILILYVHSVQSWLWNEAVSAWIAERYPDARTVQYSLGTLRFPKELPDLEVPLVGAAQELGEWERIYAPILEEAGIGPHSFMIRQIPYLTQEGDLRPIRMDIHDKEVSKKDDVATVHLTLGSGSYATVCCSGWLS